MALNDNAVVTAATGFIYDAPVGTPAPTPAELETLDPATFGAQEVTLSLSGNPTGGVFKIKAGTDSTPDLPYNSGVGAVVAAVEQLPGVGVGNVIGDGGPLPTDPIVLKFVGALQGAAGPTLTTTDTLTGGATPKTTIAVTKAPNGWDNVGHTSLDKLPEFGFDGGKTEVKGTWQNRKLREVTSEEPADYVTFEMQQIDGKTLKRYYGSNSSSTPGIFGVSGNSTKNEKALLVIIVDGDVRLGFTAKKASIRRDAAIGLPSDNFASLPVRATFLKLGANNIYEWINEDLFA